MEGQYWRLFRFTLSQYRLMLCPVGSRRIKLDSPGACGLNEKLSDRASPTRTPGRLRDVAA